MYNMDSTINSSPRTQELVSKVSHILAQCDTPQEYDALTLEKIACVADVNLDDLLYNFADKDELAFAVYEHLMVTVYDNFVEGEVIPESITFADAFHTTTLHIIRVLLPYRVMMGSILATGIRYPETRLPFKLSNSVDPVMQVFQYMTQNVSDKPRTDLQNPLSTLLYTLYALLLLFWVIDRTPEYRATGRLLDFARSMIKLIRPLLMLPVVSTSITRVSSILLDVFTGQTKPST